MRYDAFISYSHGADARLAPVLQRALHRFAKPWWRARAVTVFRDETSLAAAHSLPATLARALDESAFFILMASPAAARSKWVADECEHFVRHRDPTRMLIVLSEGEIAWDAAAGDFDWNLTSALPERLKGVFRAEPLYVDLRWARPLLDRADTPFNARDPRFLAAVARLSAALRGVSLEAIAGEDLRQHRKTRRIAYAAVSAITLLAAGAGAAAWLATENAREAERRREVAERERERAERSLAVGADAATELAIEMAHRLKDLEGVSVQWRKALLERAEAIHTRLVGLGDSDAMRAKRALTLLAFAQLYVALGLWEQASGRAEEALSIIGDVAKREPNEPEWQDRLMRAQIALGDVKFALRKFEDADRIYRAAFEITKRLAEANPSDPLRRHDLATGHSRLGLTAIRQGRPAAALEALRLAEAIMTKLVEGNRDSVQYHRDLAAIHASIGDAKEDLGDKDGALDAFGAAIDAMEKQWHARPYNMRVQIDLARLNARIGIIQKSRGKHASALEFFRAALTFTNKVASWDPLNTEVQSEQALSHSRIGESLEALVQIAAAVEEYVEARRLIADLVDLEYGNLSWKRDLVVIDTKIGMARMKIRDIDGAESAFRGALPVAVELAKSGDAPDLRNLYLLYLQLGLVAEAKRNWVAARDDYVRGKNIIAALASADHENKDWRNDLRWVENRLLIVGAATRAGPQ